MATHFQVPVNPEELINNAKRSMTGTLGVDGLRRERPGSRPMLTMEELNQLPIDYYSRKLIEITTGKFSPQRVSTFKGAVEQATAFFKMRFPYNYQQFVKNGLDNVGIAVIPCLFKVKVLPTDDEKEAWQKRWNDDGDLEKLIHQTMPGCEFLPVILHTQDPKEPVMFAITVVYSPV